MEPNTEHATGVAAKEALASRLYPPTPAKAVDQAPNATIAALRASEPARQFYKDADQLGNAPRELTLASAPGANAAEIEATSSAVASIMTDLGMSRDDVSQLASFAAANKTKPPTADEQRTHALTAVRTLRETYGEDFDSALQGAKALAQRDPRLRDFLNANGLANNPWVVARLAELSRTARNAATLKRK